MVVPAREPASLGTSHEPARPYNRRVGQTLLSYEVNQSVVLRWGRREGKRRQGAACLLSSIQPTLIMVAKVSCLQGLANLFLKVLLRLFRVNHAP